VADLKAIKTRFGLNNLRLTEYSAKPTGNALDYKPEYGNTSVSLPTTGLADLKSIR